MKLQIVIGFLISTLTAPAWAVDCGNFIVSAKNDLIRINNIKYVNDYAKAAIDKQSDINDDASITLGHAFENFEKIPKNLACRSEAWKTLIELIIAAAPYDKESQGAHFIAKLVKDTKLNAVYLEVVQNTGEICRRKFIAAMVTEVTCMRQNQHNPKAPELCIPKDAQAKNIDSCLSPSQKAEKSGALEDFQGSSVTAAQL